MNYYNELDPYAAQWLRNLIAKGLIPDGKVDERDIRKVKAKEIKSYTQAHFFAGIAGWSYALKLAGWPEDEEVWTGSCPCQPFSIAGKGKGKKDKRHLWPVWRELIAECRPTVCFGEQVGSPLGRDWLDGVRIDLEALGYEVGCADLCAAGIDAPHLRQRLFWVADSGRERQHGQSVCLLQRKGRQAGQVSEVAGTSGASGLADAERNAGESRRLAVKSRKSVGTTQARPHAESGRRSDTGRLVNAAGKRTVKCKTSKPGSDGKDDGISGSASARSSGLGNTSGKGSRGNARAVLGKKTTRKSKREKAGSELDQSISSGFKGGGLGNTNSSKLAGWKRKTTREERQTVAGADPAGKSPWADYELVHCADGKARRIESGPQQMADGFSEVLGQLRSNSTDEIERKLRDAIPDEAHAREILRDLWIILAKKAVQRTAGKLRSIYEAPVLLAIMRELARKGWKLLDHLPSACWETPEAGLRKLRQNALQASRPSYRRAVKQQYANKPADVMSVVSQAFAQAGEEAGMIPFPLAKGVLCRVGKLRAYGNAIVPILAAEFITAYLETRRATHV